VVFTDKAGEETVAVVSAVWLLEEFTKSEDDVLTCRI
jgi:hypothetical protein